MGIGFSLHTRCRDVASFQQTLDQLAAARGYQTDHDENSSTVSLCRLGNIYFEFTKEKKPALRKSFQIYAECQTNLLGAGFHKAAIEFIDELRQATGRDIEVEDETEYYTERDFEAMRTEHFYNWLHRVLEIGLEQQKKGARSSYICWDIGNYQPEEVEGTVVTPFGRIRPKETLARIEREGIEPFAREFFIWNEPEQDARFHRNLALHLLWEECLFMPSARSEEDNYFNGLIIRELEEAARLDPAQPFPKDLYREVCTLHGHAPIALDALPDYTSEYPVGYRRGWVGRKVGNLTYHMPGNHLVDNDEGTNVFYDDDGENWHILRCTAYSTGDDDPHYIDMDEAVLIEERAFDFGTCRFYDLGEQEPDAEGEDPYYCCACHVLTHHQYTLLTLCARDRETTLAYGREILSRLSSEKPDKD